jgi:hypothetical protein
MRARALLAFALGAACGAGRASEPLERPAEAPASFVNYRIEQQGCIFGDCVSGAFARRVDDRVISGIVGAATLHIDWERGPCEGWAYQGPVAGDVPDGTGVLSRPEGSTFTTISTRFARGLLVEGSTEVRLPDTRSTQLRGPMALDEKTCAIRFPSPSAMTLDGLQVTLEPDGGVQVPFHGVVRIVGNTVVPWRGSIEGYPPAGYVHFTEKGVWRVTEPAVCLSGDCVNGRGVEHLGAGRFELYDGEFSDGLRHDRATVYGVDQTGVREYRVDYNGDAQAERLVLARPRYTIVGKPEAGVIRFSTDDPLRVEGLAIGYDLRIQWSTAYGLSEVEDEVMPPDMAAIAKLPPKTGAVLAAAAALADELPRARTPIMQELWTNTTLSEGMWRVIAVTHGPRNVLIAEGLDTVDAMVPTAVHEAWLPGPQRLLRGKKLTISPTGRLTGPAKAIALDGTSEDVVFYDGVRVDPLGFSSVAAYEKASEATRVSRAKKTARAAAAERARDERVVLGLRRVRLGTSGGLELLTTAKTTMSGMATDAPGWERVIRAGHAAVEQAQASIFDAAVGITDLTKRLDWADPCMEPLSVLGADLRDVDERLRVILRALDAFEYSDDAVQLARIAATFTSDLDALPTSSIVDHLAALQAAVDGAPQPTPGTLRKASETSPPQP